MLLTTICISGLFKMEVRKKFVLTFNRVMRNRSEQIEHEMKTET